MNDEDKTWIELAKQEWTSVGKGGEFPGVERMTIGVLQRIAKACELLSEPKVELLDEVAYYKRRLKIFYASMGKYREETRKLRSTNKRITRQADAVKKRAVETRKENTKLRRRIAKMEKSNNAAG